MTDLETALLRSLSLLCASYEGLVENLQAVGKLPADFRVPNLDSAKGIVQTLRSQAPHEWMEGTTPVILYFKNDAERDEFIKLVRSEKLDALTITAPTQSVRGH